jgi:hypothetical protein
MIITFGLWGALPSTYSPEQFWEGIPSWLGFWENTFRILIFALPGLLLFSKSDSSESLGWALYGGGLLGYLASYLMQVFYPNSEWSLSLIGFTAPSWTPLFWLLGIGLVCRNSWLPISWYRIIYILCAISFLVFHIAHTGMVYFTLVK